MTPKEIENLAKAVNRWVSFQVHCGREVLLSESYLSQPVAEFLLHKHSGVFRTEYDHPQFANAGVGRPRQIDFVLLSRKVNAMVTALEAKWIANRPYNRQAIIDDLLRLECVRETNRHVSRYFVVAGLRDDFNVNFRDLQSNVEKGRIDFTKTLLSFSSQEPVRDIDCLNCHVKFRSFYRTFQDGYGLDVPGGFRTELVGHTIVDRLPVHIWQIKSLQNRTPFSPAELKWEITQDSEPI